MKGNQVIFNASLCQGIKMVVVIEGYLELETDTLTWIGRTICSA
jgi:hypothetical protein